VSTVEVLVWVTPPLGAIPEVTGASYEATIDGRHTTVTLPLDGPITLASSSPDRGWPMRSFPGPPLAEPQPEVNPTRAEMGFGVPAGRVAIDRLRLRFDHPDFDASDFAVMHSYRDAVRRWLTDVRRWLAGWHDDDVPGPLTAEPEPRIRVVIADGPHAGKWAVRDGRTLILRKLAVLDDQQLRALAAIATSDETGFPLAHSFLFDARDYHTRDDHRHSVINACTAAEVALGEFLENHLADLADGAEEAEVLLKEATGVVELCRLAETLAELPVSVDRVIGRLAGPRNDAAHRGDRLNPDTSRHAYQTAKALVERFGPLPGPDEILGLGS
jgi:hypothetical protein